MFGLLFEWPLKTGFTLYQSGYPLIKGYGQTYPEDKVKMALNLIQQIENYLFQS